jgi:phytoene synthase
MALLAKDSQDSWEETLVTLALEARQSMVPLHRGDAIDPDLLHLAYEHCEAVTAEHSRSFYMASRLLPREKRQHVRALYAFCRGTDDIVDHPGETVEAELALWRQRTLTGNSPGDDLTAIAWTDMCQRTQMPMGYAAQLIDGVARDLRQTRYRTFEDLAGYCYGVASTVGLMSMQIMGYTSDDAIPYAIKLGIALQLTNILRDVAEDWERGRLYLPLEELAAFGLDESYIARQQVDDRWQAFMRFQVQRTRRLYAEAWPGIAMLSRDGRFSTAAAAGLYGAILRKIEQQGYDVFSRRAYVSGLGKLSRLPVLWWRTRAFSAHATADSRTAQGMITPAGTDA